MPITVRLAELYDKRAAAAAEVRMIMAEGNSVSDEIKAQRKKLAGKTPKEKLLYFWEYYRIPALVIILVIAFAGNLIYTIATAKDSVLSALFINGYSEMDTEAFMNGFNEYAGIDTKEYTTSLEMNFTIQEEAMDQYTMANVQKLMALVAAKEIDVIMADTKTFTNYADPGYFSNLNEVLPKELVDKYQDRFFYYDVPDDEQGEIPIGIQLADAPGVVRTQAYAVTNDALFGIVANSEHVDNAVKFLEYLDME